MLTDTLSFYIIDCFYHVSACNACKARYCFANSVCSMPVLCLNEWTYRHTSWPSGRGFILVFTAPMPLQSSKRNSLSEGVKYKRAGKFGKYRPLCRRRYEIGPWLLQITKTWSHMQPIDPCWLQWPWVTLKQGVRGQNILANLHNYAGMVWHRMTEFDMVTGGEVQGWGSTWV